MTDDADVSRSVEATREVAADAATIFELIADPSAQPRWDGNDNLAEAPAGQRVRSEGDVFTMVLAAGSVRENHVVEFEEGRRIAWRPAGPGQPPAGHLWRWELEPAGSSTKVRASVVHVGNTVTSCRRRPRRSRRLNRRRIPTIRQRTGGWSATTCRPPSRTRTCRWRSPER